MSAEVTVTVERVDRQAKEWEASHAVFVVVNGVRTLAALVASKQYAESRAADIERRIREEGGDAAEAERMRPVVEAARAYERACADWDAAVDSRCPEECDQASDARMIAHASLVAAVAMYEDAMQNKGDSSCG